MNATTGETVVESTSGAPETSLHSSDFEVQTRLASFKSLLPEVFRDRQPASVSNSSPKDLALQNQPDAQEVTQTVMESTSPGASAPLVAGGTKDSHTVTSGIPAPSPVQPTSLGHEAEMPNFAQLSFTSSHANQSKVNATKGMNISAKVYREEPSRMLTEPVILAILLYSK